MTPFGEHGGPGPAGPAGCWALGLAINCPSHSQVDRSPTAAGDKQWLLVVQSRVSSCSPATDLGYNKSLEVSSSWVGVWRYAIGRPVECPFHYLFGVVPKGSLKVTTWQGAGQGCKRRVLLQHAAGASCCSGTPCSPATGTTPAVTDWRRTSPTPTRAPWWTARPRWPPSGCRKGKCPGFDSRPLPRYFFPLLFKKGSR